MVLNSVKHYKNTRKLNQKLVEENVSKMKVLAHPVRYSIIAILAINKKMTVTEIYKELGLHQAAMSNHLKLLHTNHMVVSRKSGKNIYYSINKKTFEKMGKVLIFDFSK
jgi:ArsR family transcriptional regulator, zinc-responsive transcriptional repressor